MRWMKRTVVAAVCVGMSMVGLTAVPAAAADPVDYVALGDSYSAASGVLPIDVPSPLMCLRSSRNYPHVIAASTGASLTDVTCGAAQTSDFAESQYPGVPPQLEALNDETDLVTMTIGGNDNSTFIGALLACGAAGVGTLGYGSPCSDKYGSKFVDAVNNSTYPALVDALTAVHAKAPNADVAILGYPWILPPEKGCFLRMPVARGDVPYLRNLQTTLNSAVERAAAVTGSTYVDFSTLSEGHDACQPHGTRWIEPVVAGTNPVVVHPNALGEQQMATAAMTALGLG